MSKAGDTKLELDKTRDATLSLGLEHGAAALSDMISSAVKGEIAPHRFLDELLAVEISHREERRVKTSLRLSALPIGQTLSDFDWSFKPDIDQRRIETLSTSPKCLSPLTAKWVEKPPPSQSPYRSERKVSDGKEKGTCLRLPVPKYERVVQDMCLDLVISGARVGISWRNEHRRRLNADRRSLDSGKT